MIIKLIEIQKFFKAIIQKFEFIKSNAQNKCNILDDQYKKRYDSFSNIKIKVRESIEKLTYKAEKIKSDITNIREKYKQKRIELPQMKLSEINFENFKLIKANSQNQSKAIIKSSYDSPYGGNELELTLNFPENYPLKPMNFSFSQPDEFLSKAEKTISIILREKWHNKLFIRDALHFISYYLDYNFIQNNPKINSDLNLKINQLENLLNKEKEKNKNLEEKNLKLSKILEEKEEEINKLINDNQILNKKIKELEEDNIKLKKIKY